jgi:aspartyl/asparaginyl beta-hydroxylase (cupin superfamily)
MPYQIVNRIIKYPAIAFMRTFDAVIAAFALKKDILNSSDFPFHQTLAANKSVFLEEYIGLLKAQKTYNVKDFYRTASDTQVKHDDNWKAAPILLFNYQFKENVLRCPKTFQILSQLPGCCSIMYSVLGPGKHVPAHRGIYRGVYRCLFTLQMEPGGNCWLRVKDKKIYFSEGESIVFDETLEHEVKNETSQPRVALYLDFFRKLPFPLNHANNLVYAILRKSPYVLGVLDGYRQMENMNYEDFEPVKAQLL